MKSSDSVFPIESVDEGSHGRKCGKFGITIRDYIAIKAMQALITNYGNDGYESLAIYSYRTADAMIKESEKNK